MWNKVLLRVIVAIATVSAAGATLVQNYPSRPIRFIVSQAPGGPSDSYARLIARHLGDRVGQPVVVDNRAGADGIIGMEAAAKAAPDGYTIVLTATSVSAITPNLYKKVPYDPVRDYEPITHAPAGVPKDIVRKLNSEITKILTTPEIVQQFRDMGFEPEPSSPEHLETVVKSDLARFAKVVNEAGIKQQ